MTIRTLAIHGFQSHKATWTKFHHGVNCITGNSDSGKSAILRALNWLITNKVDDKAFRTRGLLKTDVEVVFEDGKEVSRVQDASNAYYLVDPANKVDLEFKAFKNLIPEDITNAVNLSSINISNQFDMPFLLSDSPGEVARTLNQIAGLSDIDTSIANIKKQVLSNNKEIGTIEQILIDLTKQKESLGYLSQMEKDVTDYEKLLDQDSKLKRTISDMDSLVDRTEKIQQEIQALNCFLKAQTEVDAILTLHKDLKQATDATRQLEIVIDVIDSSNESIIELKRYLCAENDMQEALELVEELKLIEKEEKKLVVLLTLALREQIEIEDLKKSIGILEIEFENLMPYECPLCGGIK